MSGQQDNAQLAQVFGIAAALCGLITLLLLGGAFAYATLGPEPKDVPAGRGLVLALLLLIVLPLNGLVALVGILCALLSAWKSRVGNWSDVAWAVAGLALCVFILALEILFVALAYGS